MVNLYDGTWSCCGIFIRNLSDVYKLLCRKLENKENRRKLEENGMKQQRENNGWVGVGGRDGGEGGDMARDVDARYKGCEGDRKVTSLHALIAP